MYLCCDALAPRPRRASSVLAGRYPQAESGRQVGGEGWAGVPVRPLAVASLSSPESVKAGEVVSRRGSVCGEAAGRVQSVPRLP